MREEKSLTAQLVVRDDFLCQLLVVVDEEEDHVFGAELDHPGDQTLPQPTQGKQLRTCKGGSGVCNFSLRGRDLILLRAYIST